MFSRRTGWDLSANRLAAALEARRRAGGELLDLTLSNPTRAGLPYPSGDIAEALASTSAHLYDPDPRGSLAAREAVASWYASRGLTADPDRILLTSSTSEAYGWLFKLLCDPGDRILVPRPSYPLFEFLATLESVQAVGYPLHYEGRWALDRDATAHLMKPGAPAGPAPTVLDTAVPRAIVLVNPNNPTGSYVSRSDLEFVVRLAREHELALISDEVFSTYPLTPDAPFDSPSAGSATPYSLGASSSSADLVPTLLGSEEAPGFVLDGLSKSAGLPGVKIGWIIVLGPARVRARALERLEVIADTYLPVSTPIQTALPRLIQLGALVSSGIRERTRANLRALRAAVAQCPAFEVLNVEGGWSAILRVPRTRSEEEWCLLLLEEAGVLVQPGWFFDFAEEAFLVVSLLPPEPVFAEGLSRILARAE